MSAPDFFRSGIRIFAVLVLVFQASCSTGPKSTVPDWISQPARTVEGGYVIYVGRGEDRIPEQALFKAEGSTIQDIANECSFAPKGTRTEDRYDNEANGLHNYYVKTAVSFEDCEEARKATDPEEIKKLANAQLTEQLDKYQAMLESESGEEPPPEATAQNEGGTVTQSSGGTTVLAPSPPPPTQVVVINNPNQYYLARQQVVYMKQAVILAPPNAYAPQSPESMQFTRNVTPAVTQIHSFEAQNPTIRTSPTTWSQIPRQQQTQVARPQALRARAANYRPYRSFRGGAGNYRAHPQYHPNRRWGGGGWRRRR